MVDDESEYLTPADLAEKFPKLGNAAWFRQQMIGGYLHGFKVRGRWFSRVQDVHEMMEAGSNHQRRRRKRLTAPEGFRGVPGQTYESRRRRGWVD